MTSLITIDMFSSLVQEDLVSHFLWILFTIFFEGNKEYFKGLACEEKWNWDISYPVIKIAFGKVRSSESLKQTIEKILDQNQERLNVECNKKYDYANCFWGTH